MPKKKTYGFQDKKTAEDLKALIGGGDGTYTEGIVRGRGWNGRLFRFTLNATLASGTADADILEMDGTDTGIDDTVRDPEGIFASLVTVGDSGLCLMQDGKFYVIQAPCP